ncbi:ribosome maturation factor RimM [Acuticoccus sp. M5D2P5]|uniref:ribosome maturation factor RimM n=1 Tax=Acuticoccus kalidii TaxID=2910977 RepID=UPI001EEBFF91|nr:ribosome maturation factor RimM [Acuticoccus kalidii]MCF3932329.1 ribosome maturation factor RimM [Acuticoccus kalidii]
MSERRIVIATIGAPHGVRGAVKLNVFAEDPLALRRYNPFEDEAGRRYKLTSVKPIGKAIVAAVEGIADRNAAETLRGTSLMVPRSRLPRPEDDEFYHVDLIGLEARLVDGAVLGIVRNVADYGAGDILDIEGERDALVPFTRAVVPEVNIAEGYLVIDPPLGLLDDAEPGEGEMESAEMEGDGSDADHAADFAGPGDDADSEEGEGPAR